MDVRLSPWQQFGLLVLAVCAITAGCSADNVAAALQPTASAGLTGLPTASAITTSVASLTPAAVNTSGVPDGRGTTDDASSAARAADAIWSTLAGGALEAADLEGGPIDDPDFNTAALRARATVSGSANSVEKPTNSFLFPQAIGTLRDAEPGNATASADGSGTLRFTSPAGFDVKATGMKATIETTAVGGAIDGFELSSTVRLLGVVGSGPRPELDVKIAGVSGVVGRTGDGANAIDMTIASPGVTVQGVALGARIDATFSGVHGHFIDVTRMSNLLRSKPISLHVQSVVARDLFDAMHGELAVSEVDLPRFAGDWFAYKVSGSLDATLSSKHVLARSGRVTRVTIDIDSQQALAMRGLAGPDAGSAVLTLHNYNDHVRDQLRYDFSNGVASISGNRTNASGETERITSAGDSRRAAGSVSFTDGSRSEHQLDVRHSRAGRRIAFQFLAKDPRGGQSLAGDAVVHADRTVTGHWTRPAPHGADGTFLITPDGELDLLLNSGEQVAHAQLRDGWNDLLY